MSDEPLYCPFCGAEDYQCDCPMPEPGGNDPREIKFCETCGFPAPNGTCKECDS